MSCCPKCGFTQFVSEPSEAKNLNVHFLMIKCSSCNTAIGVFDVITFDRIKAIIQHLRISDPA